MAFSPNLFLSNINAKDGLARPCKFEVIIPIPAYINNFIENSVMERILNLPNTIIRDITDAVLGGSDERKGSTNTDITRYLALQCETAEFPGKQVMTAEHKIYGPVYKFPYMTQYLETNTTFICTNDFYERKLFDTWVEAMQPTDTNNMRYPDSSLTRYRTTIKVIQYDDFIKQIYAQEFIDAFPVAISPQPLSWQDENIHRVSVQWAYSKYRTLYDGKFDLGNAAGSILGGIAAGQLPFTI